MVEHRFHPLERSMVKLFSMLFDPINKFPDVHLLLHEFQIFDINGLRPLSVRRQTAYPSEEAWMKLVYWQRF